MRPYLGSKPVWFGVARGSGTSFVKSLLRISTKQYNVAFFCAGNILELETVNS
jgi:hypothetical protein